MNIKLPPGKHAFGRYRRLDRREICRSRSSRERPRRFVASSGRICSMVRGGRSPSRPWLCLLASRRPRARMPRRCAQGGRGLGLPRRARPALEKALKAGTAGPADLAEIYKLTGIVEAALGNRGRAQTAFGSGSRSIRRARCRTARRRRSRGRSTPRRKTGGEARPARGKGRDSRQIRPSVTLVVVNDPQKMIVGAQVYFIVDRKPEQRSRPTAPSA